MKNWQEKPRILIVDDDDEFIADLKVLLSSEFEICTASGTEQAGRIIDRYRPECLLLDLKMPAYFGDNPNEEGFSFLKYIRDGKGELPHRDLPVIIITASEADARNRAREFAISTLYPKPPDIKRLKASIWNLVQEVRGTAS